MANTGGTRAPGGKPSQNMAHQRYYNRASGHMETAKQMHKYQAPAHHAVPQGHKVSGTKQTVTQTAAPVHKPPIDLFHMNDAQRLAFAKKLVSTEVNAGRVPFQQAEKRLEGQEGATRENTERLATQGNQAGAALVAQQQQAGAAGEQRAREAQTQAVMPTEVQQANAARGVAPTEQGSRQEALLKALGQGGVNQAANARAAGEKWAQSQQAGYQQMGTAAVQAVGTRFGAERQKNRDEEAAYVAKGQGQTTKLYTELTSEKQKFAEAAKATRAREVELGLKSKEAARKDALTEMGIIAGREGQKESNNRQIAEGIAGRRLDWRHLSETERHNFAMEQAAAAKQRWDEQNKKEGKHSATSEKATNDTSAAFWAMSTQIRKAVGEGKAGKHVSAKTNKQMNREIEARVRAGLPQGKAGEPQAHDPAAIQAGIELWYTHKISKATRAALGRKGINIGYDQDIYRIVAGR